MIKVKFTELAKELMNNTKNITTDLAFLPNEKLDFTPKRATSGSSGYALSACIKESLTIWQDEVVKIPTGVCIWIGNMYDVNYINPNDLLLAGLYLPRSSSPGLKLENTVGLLDSDYQGESFFKYRNISNFPITINPGDKIGQLVIIPTYIGNMTLVEEFEETTERGEGGLVQLMLVNNGD
jgi:dUTP pyrophosphatase